MFQAKPICIVMLVVPLFIGCAGGSAPKPKTAEIANSAKANVDQTVEQILESPQSAHAEVGLLIESLEAHAREYGGSFKELLDTAKSVQSELSGKPDKERLESILGRLTAAANKLVETTK